MTDINGDNSIELDVPKDNEKNIRTDVKFGATSNNVVLEQKHPLKSPTASVSTTSTNTNNVIQRTRSEEATIAKLVDNNSRDKDNNDSNNNGPNNTNDQQQQQRQQRSNTSPEISSEGQYDFSIPSSNARNNKNNNNNNDANVNVINNGSQLQQQLTVEQQNETQSQQRLIQPSSLHNSATVNNNNLQADIQNVKQNIENLRQEKFNYLFTSTEKDPKKIVATFKTAIEEFPEIFEQTTDEYGRSALHLAILSKNYKLVQWLLDEGGARENAVDIENQSIAHYAAYVGNAEILTYLIDDARCSINMKDKTGRSLISHAAMRNNWRIIDLLVSKYKMDIDSTDHFGTNALHWAAAKGAIEAGLCLVQKGINIHLKVLDQSAKQIIEKQKEKNENNSIFYTFLNLYEKIGNEFLSLVSKKATTINNLKDKMVEWDKFSNEYSKISSLKAEKVKIQYFRNRLGQTALHIAAHKQNIDIVKFLVENQFYITAEDYLKRLPVHYAALYGKQDIATYLINMPASEDEKQIRRRRDGGEDDEGAVQVVKHWKKKTKTGLTPDKMAGKGYEAKMHSNEKLQELLLNFAQVRGQPTQQQHQQPQGNIRGTDVPRGGSEKALEEAIEDDKSLVEGPAAASGNMEDLVGKGASIVLDRCKLPQYVERFNEDGFDTIESLKNLNESDLKDMGVKKGHIRVIMNYLHEEYPTNDGSQEASDTVKSKSNAVANVAKSNAHAVSAVVRNTKNANKKPLHRANTSPDLNTKRRKTIDSESTDELRKLLTGDPTVAQDVNRIEGNFTKSMVITKDENNLFKKGQRNSAKERVVYIAEDDLSFKNNTPGNFGHKSKTATWKTMDVVVKYIEEACLEGCREIYRLINLDESRHQNVLPYLGICVHPASVVVNYMNSGSLRDHLYQTNKQGNLLELREIEWSDVVDWVSQAATGIKFLHDKGVVHGGVATHSFMMQSTDNDKYILKVSDFGLNRPVKNVELAGRKLHWDAPELVIDGDEDDNLDKVFSRETDSYGFGMCLYEVMHRVQPWKKVKNIDVKKKLENRERPVVNALLSEDAPGFVDIRAIMKSCWEHDPRERSNFETITRVINYSALQCRESEQILMLPIPSIGGGENQSSSSSEDENQNNNIAPVSTTPEKIAEVQTPLKEKDAEKEVTLGLSPLDGRKGPVRSAFDLLAPPSDDEDKEDEKDVGVTATDDNIDDVVDAFVNSPKMSLNSPQQRSPVGEKRQGLGELEELDMGPSQAHNSVFDLLAPPPGIDDD